ncbi:MAG: transposase [Verrucomicrobia bacterium]|nr:transposase [Verrucomicrobiota bacterium]
MLSDERVWFSEAGEFRRIRYRDPESGTVYELLTTEFHLPPGIIAQIYRLRWDIEKFFDVCENLLAEARAWGAGPVPAQVQNEFLVLVHNLLILLSTRLEAEEGLRDEKVEVKVRGGASSPGTRGQVAGPVGVALGAGVATDHSLEQSVYPMAAGCLAASLGVDRRPGQAAATHARLSPLAPLAAPANPLTDPPTSMLSHPCPPAVPFSMQHALALSLFVEVTPIGRAQLVSRYAGTLVEPCTKSGGEPPHSIRFAMGGACPFRAQRLECVRFTGVFRCMATVQVHGYRAGPNGTGRSP